MRRVLFTESQIRSIIGESGFTSYLPDMDNTESGISYGTETGIKQPIKGRRNGGPTSDKAAKEKAPGYQPWRGRVSGPTLYEEILSEENKDLQKGYTCGGEKVPTGTINYWKNQEKNGKELSPMQKRAVRRVDTSRDTIRNGKQIKKDLGTDPHPFIDRTNSVPKNQGAHTKKNTDNNVSIQYEY